MKRKEMSLIIVAVMLGAICCASGAFAEGDHDKMPPAGHHRMEGSGKGDFLKGLDLTPEQRDKLKTHREENMKVMKEIRDEMKEQKTALRDELKKKVIDSAKIADIAAKLKKLSAEMVDQRISSILSLREILTPEQFQKMQADMEKKHKEHGRKGGDRGMPPPPPDESE